MTEDFDLDARLRESARLLDAWKWMASISTRRSEAAQILLEEARFLIRLGLAHPKDARRIGKLIVAYRLLIGAVEDAMAEQSEHAA